MIEIRRVQSPSKDEFQDITAFYLQAGYSHAIPSIDKFVLAINGSKIVGSVRLVCEESLWLLRGMQIHPSHQRQGIGTNLLKEFQQFSLELKAFPTYCIPYGHLESFYGMIGFRKFSVDDAPKFLQDRMNTYLKKRPDVILMKAVLPNIQ